MYSDCRDHQQRPGNGSSDDSEESVCRNHSELVRPCDIKGILHSHSRWVDGAHSLESMVQTAVDIDLEYLGISDHFQTRFRENGLDSKAAKVQRLEIERLKSMFPGFDILQGVEIDANLDGTLPVDEAILAEFDFVICSIPENGGLPLHELADMVIKVARHPLVTILGRPVGDLMLRACHDTESNMVRVLKAASESGTAVEVNANPNCDQIDWGCCRMAQDMGVYMAISPDAHRAARLVDYRHGAELAHDAGVHCRSVLNTLDSRQLRSYLETGVRPS